MHAVLAKGKPLLVLAIPILPKTLDRQNQLPINGIDSSTWFVSPLPSLLFFPLPFSLFVSHFNHFASNANLHKAPTGREDQGDWKTTGMQTPSPLHERKLSFPPFLKPGAYWWCPGNGSRNGNVHLLLGAQASAKLPGGRRPVPSRGNSEMSAQALCVQF